MCMLSVCSRCWTQALPASNACRWLTAVLKHRFCFVRRFLHFIASLACCNPNACCPPLCFDFTPRFASFCALYLVFRVLHRFSAPLHDFLHPFALLSALCIVSRTSHGFLHFYTVFRTCFALSLACRLHCLVSPLFCFLTCICI